jgi:hypothetical protein
MANVRLYASKMRTDAKMHSLAADLEMFKQEAAPELEVAQKVARKAQPKKKVFLFNEKIANHSQVHAAKQLRCVFFFICFFLNL